MELNGGDVIAGVLKEHGVKFLFTLCGGHISPILVGCKKAGITVIDVRSEVNAVFAADAVARLTGVPGVAAVTAGPGVTNTITALKNAQLAQSPLVLLGGSAATVIKGRGSLQDIDQVTLLQSVVKSAITINRNCDIVPVLEHAFQAAQSDIPGPVFVECPIDLLYDEQLVREWYGTSAGEPSASLKSKLFRFYLDRHVDRMFACDFDTMKSAPLNATAPAIKSGKVDKAVKAITHSRQPVVIVGSQAILSPDDVGQLPAALEKINAPVFLTGMARGLLGRGHPLQMRHHRKKALKAADLVLIAGMPCDFRLGYGRAINPRATVISTNRSKADLNLNRKPDIGVHGDPATFLRAVAAQLDRHAHADRWQGWLETLRAADNEREKDIAAMAAAETEFVNPLVFFRELETFLTDDSVLVADGGDFVATASYILQPRSPLSWLDPGVFGTLGVGAGFAIGSQLCRPASEIWLIYGDGAAGYSLQEFDTYVRHQLPVIAVVGNDAAWAQIARDQIEVLKDDVGTALRRTDYHTVAQGFGATGLVISKKEEILPTLHEARNSAAKGKPVLVNVLIGKTDFRKGSISM